MRRTLMMNLCVLVFVSASPVPAPTVKPENVSVLALAPLVIRMSTAESVAGAVIVTALLRVKYW